ncbi:hypothetical protein QQF64_021351 [Cirrhinus molitorella]|uniref:Uncharacterized protein n=2 Tax=Cirrhinus molitorella TaxID=172907 RepID=A0AA88PJ46_9TELE|nr:hypothetical protein Q8A67_016145 [Cirrhinus molitorella]
MKAVFILCSLVTLFYLVSCCEQNYYDKDGECCKKCGPGKRMLVDDNCDDPRCQDCQDGEYQSGYTSETRCERQPSCDPNLHFKPQPNPIKTDLIKCECQDGYYCTQDDDCNTCRKHTVCTPGQKVVKKGTSKSDTLCEACKNGTFSSQELAETCQEWITCQYGYDKNAPGSSTSDRICLDGTPAYRVVIWVMVVFIIILGAVALFIIIKCKMCAKLQKQTEKITCKHIRILREDTEDIERAVQPINQQQPEEDLDDSTPVSPTPSNITENGYPVQQEHGKESISSHPESNSYA